MKNFLYWLGNAVTGLAGIAITFGDKIIPTVFPEHTVVNKLAIPITLGLKFLWDSWKYRKGNISTQGKKIYDQIPNKLTGAYNSKLPSGIR